MTAHIQPQSTTLSRLFFLIILCWHPLFFIHAVRNNLIVGGYLPDYRSYINVNATSIHLSDLILFSVTPETVLSRYECCISNEHYDIVRKAKAYKFEKQGQALRLLLTVGGAGRSKGFEEIIGGNSRVQVQFIEKLVDLCKVENLDGIDLDYEGIRSLNQWNSYLDFIKRAAKHLHQNGLLLTVAIHPGQYLPSEVCERVDRVHLMTYDMIGASLGTVHHAEKNSVEAALKAFVTRGCSPSKLVMGIPAYARHSQNPEQVKTYSEIFEEFFSTNLTASSIAALNNVDGYYFDSPQDIQEKVDIVVANNFKGVFLWELGQDKQLPHIANGGILLEAAAFALINAEFNGAKSDEL